MILSIFAVVLSAAVAVKSVTHSLGVWLTILVSHGLLVEYLGQSATHLPMYIGITILAIQFYRGNIRSVDLRAIGIFSFVLLFMILAAIAGLDIQSSLTVIALYAKGMLLAIAIATLVKSLEQIKLLTIYCLIALVLGACVAVYQLYTGQFTIDSEILGRAASLRGDPNDTAMLLLSGLSLAAYWFYQAKANVWKVLSAISILLLIAAIALTGSRGGFVSLVVVGVLLYVKQPNLRNTIFALVTVLAIGLLAPASYWDRMSTLVRGEELPGSKSLELRSEFLKRGLVIFARNPVTGVGPGNFGKALQESYQDDFNSASRVVAQPGRTSIVAHNMYLEFFVENGAIAGVGFLLILITALLNLLRFDRLLSRLGVNEQFGIGYSLATSIFAMLFAGLFLSQAKNSVLWFLIGIAFSVASVTGSRDKNRVSITLHSHA